MHQFRRALLPLHALAGPPLNAAPFESSPWTLLQPNCQRETFPRTCSFGLADAMLPVWQLVEAFASGRRPSWKGHKVARTQMDKHALGRHV